MTPREELIAQIERAEQRFRDAGLMASARLEIGACTTVIWTGDRIYVQGPFELNSRLVEADVALQFRCADRIPDLYVVAQHNEHEVRKKLVDATGRLRDWCDRDEALAERKAP